MSKRIVILLSLCIIWPLSLWSNGWITVRTSVLGAEVTVDEMESFTMHVHELSVAVNEGLHLVIVNKDGYHPKVDTITIHEGENKLLPMWLEPTTKKTVRRTTEFKRTSWDYQLNNGLFALRWAGVGGGIGTGFNFHVSLFDMRYGLLTIDPCLFGINLPFFGGMTHVQVPWQIHPRDRRSPVKLYEMAIPSPNIQLYITPMIGVVFPLSESVGFTLSAAPQISWTRITWEYQTRELPSSYAYEFTDAAFPTTGFQFDPVWFSVQAGMVFNGNRSDMLTYFKYQDGYFLGVEFRF